ncbi:MAG: class I SAM-dependent RNA methyltransferase [Gemmatimonadales bacterium]|nr:MAG: class I SAM-dependent RNA methyltransferase [Gemmatimonadales bacterium]
MSDPVRITGIATGGDGVGRMTDGRTIFIPRTAPGDLVEPVEVRLHSSYAKGWAGTLSEASSDRVIPRCAHYDDDACGGCQVQHLSAAAQREAKRKVVENALRRIGGVQVEVPPVETGPEWGYRNRITITVTADGTLGFHKVGQPRVIFDLTRCEIARPSINQLLVAVRQARSVFPPRTIRITLREGRRGELGVVLWGERTPSPAEVGAFRDALERGCSAGVIPELWWRSRNDLRSKALSTDTAGIGAVAFEQVQPEFGDQIRGIALDLLGEVQGRLVWDLYAGQGEATASLVGRGARVESVERDPALVALAERQVFPLVRRLLGRVEDLIVMLSSPDAAIVNPPRAGLGAPVTKLLLRAAPERIAYVSCDPATLARDLGRLAPAYRVETVRVFDLFPQTAHVESVALLVRR